MSKATVTREEVREQLHEDEVLSAMMRTWHWAKANSRRLIGLAIVLLAVLIVWQMIHYRNEKALSNSNLDLMRAQTLYQQGMMAGAPGSKEREQPLQECVRLAQDLRANYGATPAARVALHLEAAAYLLMGDKLGESTNTDKAIAIFRQFSDTATTAEEKCAGLLGLAAAYENRSWLAEKPEDLKQAESTYQDVTRKAPKGSYLIAEAQLALARLAASRGDMAAATSMYREVLAERERKKEEVAPAKSENATPTDQQRDQLRKAVEGFLGNFTQAADARQRLDELVPPSAKDLGLELPGAEPAAKPAEKSGSSAPAAPAAAPKDAKAAGAEKKSK